MGVREGTAEFKHLREDFVSFSSPDRTKLIQNTLSDFAAQMGAFNLSEQDLELSFFRLLFNNSNKFGSNVSINLIEFSDENGDIIASYDDTNGWKLRPTPAESARLIAFYNLWNQTLADAQAELDENPEQILNQEIEMSFLV